MRGRFNTPPVEFERHEEQALSGSQRSRRRELHQRIGQLAIDSLQPPTNRSRTHGWRDARSAMRTINC
jgi:hypothetical protein